MVQVVLAPRHREAQSRQITYVTADHSRQFQHKPYERKVMVSRTEERRTT